jgi:ABC-type antimicrobial peptide transport system permease subunit
MLLTFAAVAILLAAGGIYGTMLYSVSQRRRELGIRVALGAGRGKVLGIVVGQGAKLALIGIAVGIAGSLALSRFLSAMVYGISTTDAPTFILVAILLGLVAVAASYLPARRAAAADPLEALRSE